MKRAYRLNILKWMWQQITERFKSKEEILKWNYYGKIGAKSKNSFQIKKGAINNSEEENDRELMVKQNVINDYREIASIAYVSLFDSHYQANGMKVQNLLGAYATKRNILFSTRSCKNIEKGKYPGAYVFSPKKGIETKRPVIGLDFASLYLCLIMAYNLSPEKMILTYREADIVQKNRNNLHKIEFLFNNCIVHAWCVRHNNQFEKKGLYPIVLEDLFNKRVNLKAQLASLGKKKEHLEKIISSVKEKSKKITESLNSEYSSICFNYNCLNFKQFALKVYMNTFYKEAGNSKSPFFLHKLAGGIISAGQYNIDLVAKFVSEKGFRIKYKDTDSLYLTCLDKYYEKYDRAFNEENLSKKEYWSEIVKITMNVMKKLHDEINAYLSIKNGTSYLKIAYKEVLFPVCFTGKKKYFGVLHEEVVNFKPDNLFKKGIDSIKQGQSQLFKFIREKIMWEAMDINNIQSIHKIVEDTLREAKDKQSQMKEKKLNTPDPSECFSYVVVKGERYRDEKNRLIPYRVKSMLELCVQFINEDKKYQPLSLHKIMQLEDSDEKEKQIDAYSQKEAKK
ncbi:13516_t:CDS:2 [Cetraspora pellucida]|uniref:13516_t:CDS:1 n=1 Tax=Cetraspora pellucida TaxID=1433469 RepID=A0ACA9L8L2_9GLOM|nr:13516_t:CDS:2 [Cetraspora pellucida]